MGLKLFVSAINGGIEIQKSKDKDYDYSGSSYYFETIGFAKTAEELVKVLNLAGIDTNKVYSTIYFTSSMDFADEYGFETHDGAKKIWNEAWEGMAA